MGESLVTAEPTPVLGGSVLFLPQPDGGWDPGPLKRFLSPVFIDSESQRELETDEVPGVRSPREKDHYQPPSI